MDSNINKKLILSDVVNPTTIQSISDDLKTSNPFHQAIEMEKKLYINQKQVVAIYNNLKEIYILLEPYLKDVQINDVPCELSKFFTNKICKFIYIPFNCTINKLVTKNICIMCSMLNPKVIKKVFPLLPIDNIMNLSKNIMKDSMNLKKKFSDIGINNSNLNINNELTNLVNNTTKVKNELNSKLSLQKGGYNYIVDPESDKKILLSSRLGTKILKKYLTNNTTY